MSLYRFFILIVFLQFYCIPSFAEEDANSNPLLANSWILPSWKKACIDTDTYNPNGTFTTVSGEQVTEGTYSISKKLPSGFYRLTTKTLKDSGGTDCYDSSKDDTGRILTSFIKFISPGEYIFCSEEKLNKCIGYYRTPDKTVVFPEESLPECTDEMTREFAKRVNASYKEKVVYPHEVRLYKREWQGILGALEDAITGRLLGLEIIQTTGNKSLDQAMIDAVNSATYPTPICKPITGIRYYVSHFNFMPPPQKDNPPVDAKQ